MALYTQADLEAVKDALIRVASEGVASANVAGQTYTFHDIDKLQKLCDVIRNDLDGSTSKMGIRFRKIRPFYE